jgi:hypothetical protein
MTGPAWVWTHIACTYSYDEITTLAEMKIYINGEEKKVGTGLSTSLGSPNDAPLKIGNSGDCIYHLGFIDELQIYNYALSATDIGNLSGADGQCKFYLTSAKSRKTHGTCTPDFDLDLDLSATGTTSTVEMRRDGPTKIIFTFVSDIVVTDGGTVDDGEEVNVTGALVDGISQSGNELTLDLIDIVDETIVTVDLTGLENEFGDPLSNGHVEIYALTGDVNQDGIVNGTDVNEVRSNFGLVDENNFQYDVNTDCSITNSDVPLVLLSASSEKVHGPSGNFGLPLNLKSGFGTVEMRSGGPTTIIFTFSREVQAADGTLSADEFLAIANASFYDVDPGVTATKIKLELTSVVDQSVVSVILQKSGIDGIVDSSGNPLRGDNDLEIRALVADANRSRSVSAADRNLVNSHIGEVTTQSNFFTI